MGKEKQSLNVEWDEIFGKEIYGGNLSRLPQIHSDNGNPMARRYDCKWHQGNRHEGPTIGKVLDRRKRKKETKHLGNFGHGVRLPVKCSSFHKVGKSINLSGLFENTAL